ncbi:MAG: CotH kinase family protein [Kiritimatiellae bacterium]|nr:CotH kinase family protein [Kiritimatiellia bacterium]
MAFQTAMAAVCINEVCYNNSTVADENGDKTSDWIELYNSGTTAVNINGYRLGDKKTFADCYPLPDYSLRPKEFLVIYANSDLENYTAWVNDPDLEVIPENAVWSYFTGATGPAAAWIGSSFSDADWSTGMVPIGYNDATANMDCATALGYGEDPASRYPAAYFRTTFSLSDLSSVTGFSAKVRINDGAVVYLNGIEVYRSNMPEGAISHGTFATAQAGSTDWAVWSIPLAAAKTGVNVLAVEVHQAFVASSDLIFDFSLTALVDHLHPVIHLPFGLKFETKDDRYENVRLFNPSGTVLHKFDGCGHELDKNVSYGYATDGVTGVNPVEFANPTPGVSNAEASTDSYTESLKVAPSFSVPPGFYATPQTITLTAQSGYSIYYTTDGSDPKSSATRSRVYHGNTIPTLAVSEGISTGLAWIRTNPVEIEDPNRMPNATWRAPIGTVAKAVVLRAVSVFGSACSAETRGTYFIGPAFSENRHLPTVSVTTDADGYFGFVNGIYVPGKSYADSPVGYGPNRWGKPYANYHQDEWERESVIELFELGQPTAVLRQRLGVQMHGGGTRAIPQKTLYMICRNGEYGSPAVDYPLFPDRPATSYKRFLLRNSGNDWYGTDIPDVATMLKDAVFHQIVTNLDISVMAYRPVNVFLNGEYWGIHNLRESYDKHYMATRYGMDPDNMDILMHEEDSNDKDKVHIARIDGDKNADEEYEELLDQIKLNPPSTEEGYAFIQSKIDVTNHVDYIIAETFFANTDWPINNCDFWRAHTNETASVYGDGRWRWMLYDLDVAGEKGSDFDMFSYLMSKKMTGGDEPGFLINQLWKNEGFKAYFIARYTELLNTVFKPVRTEGIIRSAAAVIEPEIEQHFRRWGRETTLEAWRNAVNVALVDFTAARYTNSFDHLNTAFTLGGTGDLTVLNNDATGTGGSFVVNGIVIETETPGVTDRAAWTGRFFRSIPVTVTAVPDQGYVFDGWVGSTETSPERIVSVKKKPLTLKARFRREDEAAYVPSGYDRWVMANYTEAEIIAGSEAIAPDADSGCAGLSNFALYAFGMSKTDGLSDEQRQARISLSIGPGDDADLVVGYYRLDDSFTDVAYLLKVADTFGDGISWRDAVEGSDYRSGIVTNVLENNLLHLSVPVPVTVGSRFFRLFVRQK